MKLKAKEVIKERIAELDVLIIKTTSENKLRSLKELKKQNEELLQKLTDKRDLQ